MLLPLLSHLSFAAPNANWDARALKEALIRENDRAIDVSLPR